jgi:hypothetical protein
MELPARCRKHASAQDGDKGVLPSQFWILAPGFWLLPLAFSSARPDQLIRKADRIKRFLRELPLIFLCRIQFVCIREISVKASRLLGAFQVLCPLTKS